MWLSCTSIGAVTRLGLGSSAQREPSFYSVDDDLAVPDFDVCAELGRKGSSTLDRLGALALLVARDCLKDVAQVPPDTGVTVTTTVGSLRSTLEFSGITITGPKPSNVPPSLFPNTVMNAAAGLVAIRHALTGPNTTIAGGKAGGIKAVSYIDLLTETALLSACLLVCVEELSAPRSAWSRSHRTGVVGEAAVAMLLTADEECDREFRMRVRTDDPEFGRDAAVVVAGVQSADSPVVSAAGAENVVDVERVFGVVDAATFGCQILLAVRLLRAGSHGRAIIPFPDDRKRSWVEVTL
jgi:hypothetical protein